MNNATQPHIDTRTKTLQEFVTIFKWRKDGQDSVLHAGCGSGDATFDIILPILPTKFKRLVGIDISDEMVSYARKTHIHPKLSFEQFNLEMELKKQHLNGIEPFDHIISFYCLMWIQNQNLCLQNFNKLLKPGGDMLLMIIANHPIYDIYKKQSQSNRWSKYMFDVDKYITPYQYSANPTKEFLNLVLRNGFKNCNVKTNDRTKVFDSADMVKKSMQSVNPFIDRIPEEDKQAYMDDIIHEYVQMGCAVDDFNNNEKECRFCFTYKTLVAYAEKAYMTLFIRNRLQ